MSNKSQPNKDCLKKLYVVCFVVCQGTLDEKFDQKTSGRVPQNKNKQSEYS